MSRVNYLEFRERQLSGSNEIPSNKKYHYTYRISTPCGKHYMGVRSCDCLPTDDIGHKYFGSPASKESRLLTRNTNNKFKILSIFPTRLLATLSESYYHHNLDVRHRSDFLNKCNANVKGISSLNYEEVGLKIARALSVVQPSGLTISQCAIISSNKTRAEIQPSGLTIYQEVGIKSAKTKSKIQPSGLTIYQEVGIKSAKTKSVTQDSGLTIHQESGLKSAKTRAVIQPSGLTIYQEVGIKANITKSEIQPNGLTIHQESSRNAAKTRSLVQSNGLTVDQESAIKCAKTKAIIQPSGLSIVQETTIKLKKTLAIVHRNGLTIPQERGMRISGANHYKFKGHYTYRARKWTSRDIMGKELGFHNAHIKCKADNLKIISSLTYTKVKLLQSLGTREEIVGQTWKDLGFGFEPK